ncbi:MAG: DNA primase [Pseudomonadota bacterium]
MSFPPSFLDEIRGRLSVSDICGKRVRLIKRGREFVGLSPFNHEKTPSFTVNDDKGFYHCFSSGKHGDIFSFVMETEGLSFPEAVKSLADEAGVAVPEQTPQAREREARRATLFDVTEAACAWFQLQLRSSAGAEGLEYFRGRGLDDTTIENFRLGYAPEGRALASAMKKQGIDEAGLLEAGLLRRPDDGRAPYAFFRGRVMFPITDRRGRVIAFGGRILGDGAAKYINSPDTPLFDKGSTLYNLANARKAAHDTGELLVTEGYMDVIALARAGFPSAVAPLGTALTEAQIQELWKLTPEPVLCFDGDAAGQRAAHRAADRALPLLGPGRSLRFAYLPTGEDPDSLIRAAGAGAMRQVIEGARPLIDMVWDLETAERKIDTPERRAELEIAIRRRIGQIADGTVKQYYSDMLRERLNTALRGSKSPRMAGRARGMPMRAETAPRNNLASLVAAGARRRQQALLATLVNHPVLLDRFDEAVARLDLAPELDKIRREIHVFLTAAEDLDSESLKRHLSGRVDAGILAGLLGKDVLLHAGFARPEAPLEEAQAGVKDLLASMQRQDRSRDLQAEGRVADAEGTADGEARFLRYRSEIERTENEIAELEE